VLVKGVADRPRTGDHIAFAVSKATLLEVADKLKQMNLEFFLARSDTALNFFDYDIMYLNWIRRIWMATSANRRGCRTLKGSYRRASSSSSPAYDTRANGGTSISPLAM
jgi:hypothetical protein